MASEATAAEELKRQRHREAVARFRNKKKASIIAMQDQVKQLQVQLQEQLRLQASTTTTANAPAPARAYMAIVQLKERLLHENTLLQKAVDDQYRFTNFVSQELEKHADEIEPRSVAIGGGDAAQQVHWVFFTATETPFYYVPLTKAACDAQIRMAFSETKRLQVTSKHYWFNASDGLCLGWRFQRSLEADGDKHKLLRFRFTKAIFRKSVTIEHLQDESWRIFNTPELYARLYCTVMIAKVVQRVDACSVVVLRNSPNLQRNLTVRYLTFKARMNYKNDEGNACATVTGNIIPPDDSLKSKMQALQHTETIMWMRRGFLHLTFTHVEPSTDDKGQHVDDHIQIELSGYVKCINAEQAHYLMVELGGIVLRWEQIVIPAHLLPASTSDDETP